MPRPSLTNEEAKRRAHIVHKDVYDYSLLNVSDDKVTIVCKTHGPFLQDIYNHLWGYGCAKCGRMKVEAASRKRLDTFLDDARKVHNNNVYDYSRVVYKNARENVVIGCSIHGWFSQTPSSHLRGSGCVECGRETSRRSRMLSDEEAKLLIYKTHQDRYEYPGLKYVGWHRKILIECRIHGEFEQEFGSHISGAGCSACGDIRTADGKRISNDEFLRRADDVHCGKYKYPTPYVNADIPITILCSTHGEFKQSPYHHINRKQGCPSCLYKTAGSIGLLLGELYDEVEKEKRFDWLRNSASKCHLPCDFIVNGKVCVEVDGAQHFRQRKGWAPLEICQDRDKLKTSLLLDRGFHVIRVEQEFYAADIEMQGKRVVELINACLLDEVPKFHIIASSDSMYDYLR
jgi:hypothetical protein